MRTRNSTQRRNDAKARFRRELIAWSDRRNQPTIRDLRLPGSMPPSPDASIRSRTTFSPATRQGRVGSASVVPARTRAWESNDQNMSGREARPAFSENAVFVGALRYRGPSLRLCVSFRAPGRVVGGRNRSRRSPRGSRLFRASGRGPIGGVLRRIREALRSGTCGR